MDDQPHDGRWTMMVHKIKRSHRSTSSFKLQRKFQKQQQ